MTSELVIDTNVLAHCVNALEPRQADAIALVQRLSVGTQRICVDEGFDVVESRNRSVIGAEYLAHVCFGSPGHYLIQLLASQGRIRIVPKRPGREHARTINRCIRNNRDRVFVGVAWHSIDKLLVSHDFRDFAPGKRAHIFDELDVRVREASECLPLLD